MPNYASINAGLDRLGSSMGQAYNFALQNRQLDISQQQADDNGRRTDLLVQKAADERRLQRNKEMANNTLGVITEANNSTKEDGSAFKSLGEFLDNDKGKDAATRLAQGIAQSNSQYLAAHGNAPVKLERGADGKFQVLTQKGTNWEPVAGEDGTPMRVSGEELAHKSRLDMYTAGVGELVYFKDQADEELKAGAITPAQHTQRQTELNGQAEELFTSAEQNAGVPREQLLKDSAASGDRHQQLYEKERAAVPAKTESAPAPAPKLGASEGFGWDEVGRRYRESTADIPVGLDPSVREGLAQKVAKGEEPSFANVLGATANIAGNLGKHAGSAASAFVSTATGDIKKSLADFGSDFKEGANMSSPGDNAAQKKADALPAWTNSPQLNQLVKESGMNPKDAEGLVVPNERNTKPAAAQASINRTVQVIRSLSPPKNGSQSTGGKQAAINYANAMTVSGHQPDAEILANLYSGDTMRGDARHAEDHAFEWAKMQAQDDLEYAKMAVMSRTNGDANVRQRVDASLKARDQIFQEQKNVSETTAESMTPPQVGKNSNRDEQVKNLAAGIRMGFSLYEGELSKAGIRTQELSNHLGSLPYAAGVIANLIKANQSVDANNKNLWFGTAKQRKAMGAYVTKTVAAGDPNGFKRKVYEGLLIQQPEMSPEEAAKVTQKYYDQVTQDNEVLLPGEIANAE